MNQTVNVKLVLDIDKNAPAAFQAFGREANKANKKVAAEIDKNATATAKKFADQQQRNYTTAQNAAKLGQHGFGGRVAGASNMASGLSGAGFGGAGAALSRAAIPLAIAGSIEKLAKFTADAAYDKYGTDAQKGRQFVREFIPGGERIQSFVDSMSGRKAKMEEADIQGRIGSAHAGAVNDAASFNLGYMPKQSGAIALAGAYNKSSAVLPSVFDRSSAMGERSYREEQRILPLRQASAKADRDAAVATAERLATEKQLAQLAQRGNELTKQRAALNKEVTGGSGPELQEKLRKLENINTELSGNLQLQRSAGDQLIGARRAESGAKGEASKAAMRADLLGRADVLDSRADTAANTASTLGGMNPYERQAAVQALKNAEQYGWDALPPEMQSLALAVGGERAQKIRQKAGMNSGQYAELGKIAPELAPGNPDELRSQADKLRQEAAQGEFDIDKATANASVTAGKDFGRFVGDIINQQFEKAKSEIINTVRLGRNAN